MGGRARRMSARATPGAKRAQRARRRARRLASNLCLHGLCCPNPANTEAERVEQGRAARDAAMGGAPAPPPPHTSCHTHRTRAGRRSKPQA